MKVQVVILAGGAGTRLWPLSRSMHHKQFLPLLEGSTLLDATLERLKGIAADANGDGVISVLDVQAVVNVALAP